MFISYNRDGCSTASYATVNLLDDVLATSLVVLDKMLVFGLFFKGGSSIVPHEEFLCVCNSQLLEKKFII
jgi:hypothetical protein